MTLIGRDLADRDALITDRYLDSLLAGIPTAGRGQGAGADRSTPGAVLDAAVRLASRRLADDLPRFHPSFRFEERLAVRLAEAAAALRMPAAVGGEGSLVPLPGSGPETDPLVIPADDEPAEGPGGFARPLLIGGTITASAISIAGAAWLAWRRTRAGRSPMGRAARAAHAMRLASTAGRGGGTDAVG